MPETKHTPGPWFAFEDAPGEYCVSSTPDGNNPVCLLYNPVPLQKDPAEAKTFAELLAAAPELLDACKAAQQYLKRLFRSPGAARIIAQLEAARAKAEGRS